MPSIWDGCSSYSFRLIALNGWIVLLYVTLLLSSQQRVLIFTHQPHHFIHQWLRRKYDERSAIPHPMVLLLQQPNWWKARSPKCYPGIPPFLWRRHALKFARISARWLHIPLRHISLMVLDVVVPLPSVPSSCAAQPPSRLLQRPLACSSVLGEFYPRINQTIVSHQRIPCRFLIGFGLTFAGMSPASLHYHSAHSGVPQPMPHPCSLPRFRTPHTVLHSPQLTTRYGILVLLCT